jgi:cytochrome oxidase Cu insertion factor (SCO1/SenC/PrrC family)
MQHAAATRALPEPQFAALVDALAADPAQRDELNGLLREDHSLYDQRGAATVVRMRGWVLLALARAGVSDAALIFVLEELESGLDPYLVTAAARALRSYPSPNETFAPFVMRALTNIRYHDEPISFESYGEYAVAATGTSPVRELLATLAWLGPHAAGVLDEVRSLRKQGSGLPAKFRVDIDRAIQAIRGPERSDPPAAPACCGAPATVVERTSSWPPNERCSCAPIASTVLQDHDGATITFKEFFTGQPTIVAFFYTRCDNPLKCSLTVTKLARVQALLRAQGLAERIHTAAITYDPGFDLPERLRIYGKDRGVRLDAHHRMLRAVEDDDALREYFELGVNFIESLVNRHRIEVYILDTQGRVAVSFERIHWDEQEVVARAVEVLNEGVPTEQTGQMFPALSDS